MTRGDDLVLRDPVEARPRSLETITAVLSVHDLLQAKRLVSRNGLRRGPAHQPEKGEGVADCAVCDLRRRRVLVLPAFERERVASDRAHGFGRSHAVAPIALEPAHAALPSAAHAVGIGAEPTLDESTDTQHAGEGALALGVREGLYVAGVVPRPEHGEGLRRRARRVQVEEHVMLTQQGT